jgi:hypothetical protein
MSSIDSRFVSMEKKLMGPFKGGIGNKNDPT